MHVFLFHNDQWHLAGQLQLQTSNPLAVTRYYLSENDASIGEDSFAYNFEYAKQFVNRNDEVALSSMLPVRLMEVFSGENLRHWLAQFQVQDLAHIHPNHCLGNSKVTVSENDNTESDAHPIMRVDEFVRLRASNQMAEYQNLPMGSIHDVHYWFVSTDGIYLYPTHSIEQKPQLIPLMIPVSILQHQELAARIELLHRLNESLTFRLTQIAVC